MQTLYEILEVAETASQETISAAYQSLCKQCQNDINHDKPVHTERLGEINRAYKILGDPEQRRRYNESLHSACKAHEDPKQRRCYDGPLRMERTDSWPQSPSPSASSSPLQRLLARMSPFRRVAKPIGIVVVVAWVLLFVTGTKVLIWQTKVEAGQSYHVAGYGDLSKAGHAWLVGRYFNGHRVVARVFWYSPNNILGRDSCPLILRD